MASNQGGELVPAAEEDDPRSDETGEEETTGKLRTGLE